MDAQMQSFTNYEPAEHERMVSCYSTSLLLSKNFFKSVPLGPPGNYEFRGD